MTSDYVARLVQSVCLFTATCHCCIRLWLYFKKLRPADGTFYCFPRVQDVIDRLEGVNDDVALAAYLLDAAGVALVPGSAFGAPGYIRISFATGMDVLEDALGRLRQALTG